jgi:hypothetical protein
VLTNEQHLKDVFLLYQTLFDDKNASFDKQEGAYFREFKKTYYTLLLTDKGWLDETLQIEIVHMQCMSLILVYSHRVKSDTWMQSNPLELRKVDHGCEVEIPTADIGVLS